KEERTLEAWITFITELSFPIAITFYLLNRIEGKLDMLNNTLQLLPDKMKCKTTLHWLGRRFLFSFFIIYFLIFPLVPCMNRYIYRKIFVSINFYLSIN